jgi:hypothetical protein
MAKRAQKQTSAKTVEMVKHDEAKRKNIPAAETGANSGVMAWIAERSFPIFRLTSCSEGCTRGDTSLRRNRARGSRRIRNGNE